VGRVVLGGWLDLMILEVFSNLWFYDSKSFRLPVTPCEKLHWCFCFWGSSGQEVLCKEPADGDMAVLTAETSLIKKQTKLS